MAAGRTTGEALTVRGGPGTADEQPARPLTGGSYRSPGRAGAAQWPAPVPRDLPIPPSRAVADGLVARRPPRAAATAPSDRRRTGPRRESAAEGNAVPRPRAGGDGERRGRRPLSRATSRAAGPGPGWAASQRAAPVRLH